MKRISLVAALLLYVSVAIADEGMWVPLFLQKYNIEDMQQKGFKLTAQDIYDVNKASLKDAVMIFGGGCTAELISNKGLVLTNHHCGFGSIQKHSSVEHDYLTDGFWAMSQSEELPNPGLTVTFLVYMEDVTDRVLAVFDESMSMNVRNQKIDSVAGVIEKEAIDKSNGKYSADVESFFYGNQYIMMVTKIYKDVRLVGAPPSSIGKFGGDTDNWVWPRHTGDFSMFRIYADKNNEPAEYSPDNVPYNPVKYFPVNIKGVKEGDFTMVFGYPGYTQEYIPSYTVDNIINLVNPLRIDLRQKKLDIIDAAMNSDRQIRIQYASKQAGIANGWKKWIGQNQGLNRLDILKEKRDYESKFQDWTDNSVEGKIYKNLLKEYKEYSNTIKSYEEAYYYYIETIYYSDILKIYNTVNKKLLDINKAVSVDEIDESKENAINSAKGFYKDFNTDVDEGIFKEMMVSYFENIDPQFYPEFYSTIKNQFGSDVEKYVEFVYDNSIFSDEDKMIDFLSKYYNGDSKYKRKNKEKSVYTLTDYNNDPMIVVLEGLRNVFIDEVVPEFGFLNNKIDSLDHLYMQAQMKMEPGKVFYPDANFTLRVSYGSIKGFKPRDGLIYDFYTTLDGVIEKDNPEIYDYDVPEKLKQLYKSNDYGKYADSETGKVHVCFIADNHTSGGNSGSPVINANGELIGVNFDRCWESTMSDIKFDPNYCRNIALDIRYVLFIVDKYAGVGYLLDEMNIIE